MLHRLSVLLATFVAALALAAAPALAGEDDDTTTPENGTAPENGTDTGEDTGQVPAGGVDTGAGGTAQGTSGAVLAGLGAGTLLLVATGGGLVLRRRDQG